MSDPNAPEPGAPVPPAQPAYQAPAPGYSAPVTAPNTYPGKTLGIVGLVLSCIFFVGISVLVGLILSIVALVQSRKAGYKNGPALAGIIISGALIVIGIIVGIILGVTLGALAAHMAEVCNQYGPGTWDVNGARYTCS